MQNIKNPTASKPALRLEKLVYVSIVSRVAVDLQGRSKWCNPCTSTDFRLTKFFWNCDWINHKLIEHAEGTRTQFLAFFIRVRQIEQASQLALYVVHEEGRIV